MFGKQPTLHTLYKGSTVRHVLIEGDDSGAKTLSRLDNGVRTVVATGTHYEMDKKAMALIQEWGENEGFKYRKHGDPPVFESFAAIVALTTLMGYTRVYDPKYKKGLNLIGDVPLAQWQGWVDKLGNEYEYGYTGTTIYLQPKVTAKHGINFAPATKAEWIAEMNKALEIRKSLGPEQELTIG